MLYDLDKIAPSPYQTRGENPNHIIGLAFSILHNGLMQPPVGTLDGETVVLAFGNSRFAAFKLLRDIKAGKAIPPEMTIDQDWLLYAQLVADVQAQDNQFAQMEVKVESLSLGEDLFIRGVSENVDRAELHPIELARTIQIYIKNFFKTSEEAGKLFRLSAPAVRNYLRLLDLPEPVKEKIDNGTISQSTARKLLTIQRVVPEKDLVDTVSEIATSKGDHADEIITNRLDDIFEHAKNTFLMWDAYRSGNPRGGPALWFLDEWTYPDPLEFNASVFLKAYPDFIPLLEAMNTTPGATIRQIQSMIIKGQRSASFIADELHLTDQLAPMVEQIMILMVPPICTACPFYRPVKTVRGMDIYCGMKMCHTRKEAEYLDKQLTNISYGLGIAIYQKEDGEMISMSANNPEHKKLFNARDESLRVRINVSTWQTYDFTDSRVIELVLVGELVVAEKQRLEEKRANYHPDYQEYMVRQKKLVEMSFATASFFWEKVVPKMMPVLNKMPKALLPLLFLMSDVRFPIPDAEFPDSDNPDDYEDADIRKLVGYVMLEHTTDEQYLYSLEGGIDDDCAQNIAGVLNLCSVDVSAETIKAEAEEYFKEYSSRKDEAKE